MGRVEPDGPRTGLGARAARILLRPSRAWDEVAPEPTGVGELYRRYVIPLAAIPAVCGALGALVFGFNVASVGVRPSFSGTIFEAAAGFGLTLIAVYLVALVIDLLAPAFGGVGDRRQAFKLAAYSGTAAWAAGVFHLYPSLAIPAGALGGLYSLYTLHLGLPKLMQAPEPRRLTYFAVVLATILVLALGRAFLTGKAAELGGPLSLA